MENLQRNENVTIKKYKLNGKEGNKGGTQTKKYMRHIQKTMSENGRCESKLHICNYIKYKCTRYTGQKRRKKIEHKLKKSRIQK